jgi:hypothetical protein
MAVFIYSNVPYPGICARLKTQFPLPNAMYTVYVICINVTPRP